MGANTNSLLLVQKQWFVKTFSLIRFGHFFIGSTKIELHHNGKHWYFPNSSSELFQGAPAEHQPRLRHHILAANPLRVNLNCPERQQKVSLSFSSLNVLHLGSPSSLGIIVLLLVFFSSFLSSFSSSSSSKPSSAGECDGWQRAWQRTWQRQRRWGGIVSA